MVSNKRFCGCLAIVFLAMAGRPSHAAPPVPSTQPLEAVVIAVLPFDGNVGAGEDAAVPSIIADLMQAAIPQGKGVSLVERIALEKAIAEQKLTLTGDSAEQARLGRVMGAKYLLVGRVTTSAGRFQVNAHLLEVETARVAKSAKAESDARGLAAAVEQLARELLVGVNIQLDRLAPDQIDAAPAASLHFMRGLSFHLAKMPDEAIAQFMSALALDAKLARARYWMAVAFFEQGEREHAAIEFARFLQEFPKHELVAKAKETLAKCRAAGAQR
jgi:TolA-binding protein